VTDPGVDMIDRLGRTFCVEFVEPREPSRVLGRIKCWGSIVQIRGSTAEPVAVAPIPKTLPLSGSVERECVDDVNENEALLNAQIGDLETPELVALAAESVGRILPRLPSTDRAAVERQMVTWRDWSDGQTDANELTASADVVRAATDGSAHASDGRGGGGDDATLARACVRMAADTASAAAQREVAVTPSLRHRLLWTARMAADRARMTAALLVGPGLVGPGHIRPGL